MQLGERLKVLREREHLTQQELADILGVSKSAYIKYERSERKPRIDTMQAISVYFDVSLDYLAGQSNIESRYLQNINELMEYISSEEFVHDQGDDINYIVALIDTYLWFLYCSKLPEGIDVLYTLVHLGKSMIELIQTGYHVFHYEDNLKEDPDFPSVSPYPTQEDYGKMVDIVGEMRGVLDQYSEQLVSKSYYHETLESGKPYYYEKIVDHYFAEKSNWFERLGIWEKPNSANENKNTQ